MLALTVVGTSDVAASSLERLSVGKNLRLVSETPCRARRTVLDTFDRALARDGTVLELVATAQEHRLRWRRNGGRLLFECQVQAAPACASDVPLVSFKAALSKVIHIRSLLRVAEGRAQLTRARVLDSRDKTVLRLEQWWPLSSKTARKGVAAPDSAMGYVHLLPMKGFDKALDQIRHALLEQPGFEAAAKVPVPAPSRSIAAPGPPRSTAETLDPNGSADAGWCRVLLGLSRALEDNHEGVIADIDTECLHDFRVACRRSRSLLARGEGILPLGVIRRFGGAFSWLSTQTGPVRDLDVFALELQTRARAGDAFAARVLPLVSAQRERCLDKLQRALRSARYRRFIAGWTSYLRSVPPARTPLMCARRPLSEVAGASTYAMYKKFLKRGRSLDADTPLETVHEWRKLAKKLRYQLDAFDVLYQGKTVAKTCRRLKKLQTYLGDLQDLCVQRELLLALIQPPSGTAAPDAALDLHAEVELQAEIGARADALQIEAEQLKKEVASRFARFDVKRRHRTLRKLLLAPRSLESDPLEIVRKRRHSAVVERGRKCEDDPSHKDGHAVEEWDDFVSFAISMAP